MKYHYLIPIISILILGVFTDANAQRKNGTKKRENTTTTRSTDTENTSRTKSTGLTAQNILQNLNTDIKVGNVGLTGNIFQISTKLNAGYKFTDWFSTGLAFKYGLYMFNDIGKTNDFALHDFGVGAYARAKVFQQFYAQVEYDINNIAVNLDDRDTIGSTYIGGGYLQGWGNWKFGAEILFILNDELRDFQNTFVEYWFQASYNF